MVANAAANSPPSAARTTAAGLYAAMLIQPVLQRSGAGPLLGALHAADALGMIVLARFSAAQRRVRGAVPKLTGIATVAAHRAATRDALLDAFAAAVR